MTQGKTVPCFVTVASARRKARLCAASRSSVSFDLMRARSSGTVRCVRQRRDAVFNGKNGHVLGHFATRANDQRTSAASTDCWSRYPTVRDLSTGTRTSRAYHGPKPFRTISRIMQCSQCRCERPDRRFWPASVEGALNAMACYMLLIVL